jgi:hypothetical protein
MVVWVYMGPMETQANKTDTWEPIPGDNPRWYGKLYQAVTVMLTVGGIQVESLLILAKRIDLVCGSVAHQLQAVEPFILVYNPVPAALLN